MRRSGFPSSDGTHFEDSRCPYISTMQECCRAPKILTSPRQIYSKFLISSADASHTSKVRTCSVRKVQVPTITGCCKQESFCLSQYKPQKVAYLCCSFNRSKFALNKSTGTHLFYLIRSWHGRKWTTRTMNTLGWKGSFSPTKRNVPVARQNSWKNIKSIAQVEK